MYRPRVAEIPLVRKKANEPNHASADNEHGGVQRQRYNKEHITCSPGVAEESGQLTSFRETRPIFGRLFPIPVRRPSRMLGGLLKTCVSCRSEPMHDLLVFCRGCLLHHVCPQLLVSFAGPCLIGYSSQIWEGGSPADRATEICMGRRYNYLVLQTTRSNDSP
jgi:hypothetical protein